MEYQVSHQHDVQVNIQAYLINIEACSIYLGIVSVFVWSLNMPQWSFKCLSACFFLKFFFIQGYSKIFLSEQKNDISWLISECKNFWKDKNLYFHNKPFLFTILEAYLSIPITFIIYSNKYLKTLPSRCSYLKRKNAEQLYSNVGENSNTFR